MDECVICDSEIDCDVCSNEHCGQVYFECGICKESIPSFETYEYRGAFSCADCFDESEKKRDAERDEIIKEESEKTKFSKGLDFGDNAIGKANREILKPQIEIAKKETQRLKDYEGRD